MPDSAKHNAFLKLSALLAEKNYEGTPPSSKISKTFFICGAPRSGTTILYQALSYCTDVGFVNNLIARFSAYPPIGIYLNQALDMSKVFTGRSNFGATEHLTEPHEFGAFWLSAFSLKDLRQPMYVPEADIMAGINKITGIAEAFQGPVLFKSFTYLWFIEEIAECLQNSYWIHITRDTKANSKSLANLYNNRAIDTDSLLSWTSAIAAKTLQSMPFRSLEDQCSSQIQDINEQITAQLSNLTPDRYYHLSLEDFLKYPSNEIRRLANFMKVEASEERIEELVISLHNTC